MPSYRKISLSASLLLICLWFSSGLFAGAVLDQEEILALAEQHGLSSDRIAVSVAALPDGGPLFAMNESVPMVVASNMKLITSAAALCMLGPAYEFKTELLMMGRLDSAGMLHGDLLVRGGADPNISGRFAAGPTSIFESWARAIKTLGVAAISGDIVADDRIFDREFVHPAWPSDQLTFWYTAPVSGLSLNDNCIDLTIIPASQVDAPPIIRMSPVTSYVSLQNACVTRRKVSKPLVLYRTPSTNNITVRGHVRHGAAPWRGSVTVHNPSLYFVHVMWETFERCGIRIGGGPRLAYGTEYTDAREGASALVHKSTLASSVSVMNKRSQNLYAEQIFKLLGHEVMADGSFDGGRRAIESFLESIGADDPACRISDGSGLSSAGRLTARQIATVLCHMYRSPHRADFMNSLPSAGTDGTLENRMDDPGLRGRIIAKTGYVSGANALSGYFFPREGTPMAFSVLVNGIKSGKNSEAKALQDDLCRALAGALGDGSR